MATKYEEIVQKCYEKGASSIGGWTTQEDRNWLAEWVSTFDIKSPTIAEIGVFQGGTSLLFLTAFPECKYYAVDNWLGGPPSPPYTNIKDAFVDFTKPFADKITMIGGDSVEIGRKWDTPLDIAFVDGNHDEDYPKHDIYNFGKWVKLHGYILVDDWSMKNVREAINQLLINNPKWVLIHTPERDGGDIIAFQRVREEDSYEVPR